MESDELRVTDKKGLITRNACSNCNRLLNVSPIYCVEVDNVMKKICGRCTNVVNNYNGRKLRQHTFEDLAGFLTYPCSNRQYGCKSIFPWEKVVTHESTCKFQFIPCVFSYNDIFPENQCSWVGDVQSMAEHIKVNHKDHWVNGSPIKFSFTSLPKNKIFFTTVGGNVIAAMIKCQSTDKYYCIVMVNGSELDTQCYQYQLELMVNDNKEKSVLLRKQKLESLGTLKEHLKDNSKLLEVDLNQIKNILGTVENITGSFGIVRKNKKLLKKITGKPLSLSKEKLLPLDESVLQELECPVCNQYMISRIFICHAGHSICSSCKERVQNCPICRSEFSKTRNYTLEKLSSKVNYPCRNREIGCPVATTSDKIRNHEAVCEMSETSCIMGCGFRFLRPRLYNHILENHFHQVLELDILLKRDVSEKSTGYYALHYNGELFRFCICVSNEYKFNVQHLGTINDEPNFRYKLEFIDPLSYGRSLSMSYLCQSLTDYPDQAYRNAIVLHTDLLKPFLEGKYLLYKISIFKV